MTIEIRLFGFGDDRPARFNGKNRLQVDIETPTSARALLRSAGIEEAADLILMDAETVIPQDQWGKPRIVDLAILTVMSAIEGG
jgi:sulfur carrier protein ThiS